MELVTPDVGLLFWMLVSFSIVLILLRKFAWSPILTALKDREDSIDTALRNAEQARVEVADLQNKKEEILSSARLEREEMIKIAQNDISEYKGAQKAKIDEQMQQQLTTALEEINQQKRAVVDELKDTVASLSVDIAEKILKKELENQPQHEEMIKQSVKELEVN